MFSEDQLEQLRSFPEISRDKLIRYFTPAAGMSWWAAASVSADRKGHAQIAEYLSSSWRPGGPAM